MCIRDSNYTYWREGYYTNSGNYNYIYGSGNGYDNAPVNIEYYFNTNSGDLYSNVNNFFTTEGFGTTPNNDNTPGQNRLNHSRVYNNFNDNTTNKRNTYKFQDVPLKPNTTYTVSAWIARGTNSSNASYWDDPFTFVVWQGSSGTGSGIEWSQDFVPKTHYNNTNPYGFERVHYTFTTGSSIGATSRVGFSPGYNAGYGTHIWGMQLEEGSSPGRYIYSYSNIGVAPAGELGYFDPRSSYLPAGAVATYTTTLTLTQYILNQTVK